MHVARIAGAQVCCAVRINVNRSGRWTGQVDARLDVVHHHDRLHAGRRAVVATGISSTGRPGTLDRVATCARRVGHCISVSRSRSSQDAVVVVAHRDVARIARAQVCCAVRINVHRSVGWAAQGHVRLDVVHHHDRLHAGRRAVVATGISSTGRPGTLDRVATCARRVGHCISVSRSRSSQDAVVVVAHRDVARIARAQVCCAVRINVHRSVGWAAQGHVRLDVVHHHDRLHAGRRAVVATGISSTGRPGTLDRVATCARRVGHCISVSRSRSSQDAVVVVAHRDVARIARAQVCCAVRINVHRSVGWAAQGRCSASCCPSP